MEKKRYSFLIIILAFFLSIILFANMTIAQGTPPMPPDSSAPASDGGNAGNNPNTNNDPLATNPETGLPVGVEQLEKIAVIFTDENESRNYLKKSWVKILGKSEYIKPLISFYSKIEFLVKPISKYTIGIEPNLSGLYVLTFVIWLTIVIILYRGLSIYSNQTRITLFAIALIITILVSLESIDTKVIMLIIMTGIFSALLIAVGIKTGQSILLSLAISFITTSFVSSSILSPIIRDYKFMQFFGIPKFFALSIIALISKIPVWYGQIIAIGAVILGFIMLLIFSKTIEEFIKQKKEGLENDDEEANREKLKRNVELLEGFRKGISDKDKE